MLPNLLRTPLFYGSAVALVALLILSNFGRGNTSALPRNSGGALRPVVVELFTSEGCSSCPSADAQLKQLSEAQSLESVQVVALEEHADYWNHLGWADPFSSEAFSQRQSHYASFRKGRRLHSANGRRRAK